MSEIPGLRRLREKDHKFKPILCYIMRLCFRGEKKFNNTQFPTR
jgi:hypothetical protein